LIVYPSALAIVVSPIPPLNPISSATRNPEHTFLIAPGGDCGHVAEHVHHHLPDKKKTTTRTRPSRSTTTA
jgi:hypothetical protein